VSAGSSYSLTLYCKRQHKFATQTTQAREREREGERERERERESERERERERERELKGLGKLHLKFCALFITPRKETRKCDK